MYIHHMYIYTYTMQYVCMYMKIYKHIHTHTHRYIAKILDSREFNSSRILDSRGGIPRAIGNAPESLSQQISVGMILTWCFESSHSHTSSSQEECSVH